MKRIINPWTKTPGYNCFGCSPDNPIGTRMHFFEEGDDSYLVWKNAMFKVSNYYFALIVLQMHRAVIAYLMFHVVLHFLYR